MKLNFEAVRSGQFSYADLVRDLQRADLITLTDEVLDALASQIPSDAPDTLLSFVPSDPEAEDGIGWTVGHMLTHVTATLEETAAVAAMMARGVQLEARLRYEVPWQDLNTLPRLQAHLQQSQRICQAFLTAWPDEPHLEIIVTRIPALGPMNAIGVQALGIGHAQSHVQQLASTVHQYSEAQGS